MKASSPTAVALRRAATERCPRCQGRLGTEGALLWCKQRLVCGWMELVGQRDRDPRNSGEQDTADPDDGEGHSVAAEDDELDDDDQDRGSEDDGSDAPSPSPSASAAVVVIAPPTQPSFSPDAGIGFGRCAWHRCNKPLSPPPRRLKSFADWGKSPSLYCNSTCRESARRWRKRRKESVASGVHNERACALEGCPHTFRPRSSSHLYHDAECAFEARERRLRSAGTPARSNTVATLGSTDPAPPAPEPAPAADLEACLSLIERLSPTDAEALLDALRPRLAALNRRRRAERAYRASWGRPLRGATEAAVLPDETDLG